MRTKQLVPRDRIHQSVDVDAPAAVFNGDPTAEPLFAKLNGCRTIGEQIEALAIAGRPSQNVVVNLEACLRIIFDNISSYPGSMLCRSVFRFVLALSDKAAAQSAVQAWLLQVAQTALRAGFSLEMLQIFHVVTEELPLRAYVFSSAPAHSVLCPLLTSTVHGPTGLTLVLQEWRKLNSAGEGKGSAATTRVTDKAIALFKLLCVLINLPGVQALASVGSGTDCDDRAEETAPATASECIAAGLAQASCVLEILDARKDALTAAAMCAADCVVWLAHARGEPVHAAAAAFMGQWGASGQHIGTAVAVARALLAACDADVVLCALPSGSSLLSGPLFAPIYTGARASSPATRMYSFQAMETWAIKARYALEAVKATGTTVPDAATGGAEARLVLDLTLTNWSHPNKRMSALAADVFCQLPALSTLLSGSSHGMQEQELLHMVLQQPERQGSRYGALMRLISSSATGHMAAGSPPSSSTTLSARSMLHHCPALLQQTLDAIVFTNEPQAVPASFLQLLLFALRRELEVAVGLPAGGGSGSHIAWIRGVRVEGAGPAGGKGHSVKERKQKRVNVGLERRTFLQTLIDAGLGEYLSTTMEPRVPDSVGSQDMWTTVLEDTKAAHASVRELCAAGKLDSSLMQQAEDEVAYAAVYRAWSRSWLPLVQACMMHPVRQVRDRAAQYACRMILPMDSVNGHNLAALLSGHVCDNDHLSEAACDDGSTPTDRQLAGSITIGRIYRAAGCPVLQHEQEEQEDPRLGVLIAPAVCTAGLRSSDPEVRVSVLELACNTQSTTAIPTATEMEIAAQWLRDNASCGHMESRKRALRSFECMLTRIASGLLLEQREADKAAESTKGKGAGREGTAGVVPVTSTISSIACSAWLQEITLQCTRSLYPGAPLDRIALCLDLLLHLTAACGLSEGVPKTRILPPAVSKGLSELIWFTSSTITSLLNVVVTASIDKVKNGAMTLLRRTPVGQAWAGYEAASSVSTLVKWALQLIDSPRDREATAGADVLSLLYCTYAVGGCWSFDMLSGSASPAPAPLRELTSPITADARQRAGKAFVWQLLLLVRAHAHAMSAALTEFFGLTSTLPFPAPPMPDRSAGTGRETMVYAPVLHGSIAAILAVMQQWDASSMMQHDAAAASTPDLSPIQHSTSIQEMSWLQLVSTLVRDVSATLPLALHVVAGTEEADAGSGGPDARPKVHHVEQSAAEGGADGQLLTAGRVDCKPGGPSALQLSKMTGPVSNSVNQLSAKANLGSDYDEGRDGPLMYDGQDAVGDTASFSALSGRTGAGRAVASDSQEHGEEAEEGQGDTDLKHMLVAAAWLCTREAVKALGYALAHLPSPMDADHCPDDAESASGSTGSTAGSAGAVPASGTWLVSRQHIKGTGDRLLDALMRLKHIGSIANAADAFQLLCSHLSLCTESQSSLARLPSEWLGTLLHRLHGNQQFILRRSAGFSAAFLSLLRSEPRGTVPVLLRAAMRALLSSAVDPSSPMSTALHADIVQAEGSGAREGEDAEETETEPTSQPSTSPLTHSTWSWRSQVHALNILRLMYRDASLGEDTAAYGAAGVRVALAGFGSKAWAVRNSSMMLFAAVAERSVGSPHRMRCNISALESMECAQVGEGVAVTTTSQYFGRYPALHELLLSQMHAAVDEHEQAEASGTTSACRNLFPLLLLLSRLPYTEEDAGQEGMPDASLFLPVLIRAAGVRHVYLRRLAGQAMAMCVSPAQSLTVMRSILDRVRSTPSFNANSLHGACLQLRACASIAAYKGNNSKHVHSSTSVETVDKLLCTVLHPAVLSCAVDLVTLEYIRVAQAWRAVYAGSATAGLVMHVAEARVLNNRVVKPSSYPASFGEPLLDPLASSVYVRHCLLEGRSEGIQGALGHAREAIRAAACKELKACVKKCLLSCQAVPSSALSSLRFLLNKVLPTEEDREVLRQGCKALLAAVKAGAAAQLCDGSFSALQTLLRAHDALLDPSARAVSLELLGLLCYQPGLDKDGTGQGMLAVAKRAFAGTTNLRSTALRISSGRAVRDGCFLSALTTQHGTHACGVTVAAVATHTILALLSDGDDEVREAGRAALAAETVRFAQVHGMPALAHAFSSLLVYCPPTLTHLLPVTLGLTARDTPDAALYLDEARCMVLLYALATFCIQSCCAGTPVPSALRGACTVAEVLLSPLRTLLTTAVRQLKRVQHAIQAEDTSSRPVEGGRAFSLHMLQRTLFMEEDDNDHAEPATLACLAVALYNRLQDIAEEAEANGEAALAESVRLVCGRADSSVANPRTSFLLLSHELIELASALPCDIGPHLLPQGPWVAHSGPDDCPYGLLWPAARVAEALLSA